MADQLTDLGFRMDAEDAMDRYFAWGMDRKELIDLEDGLYLRWQTEPGIQCWLSLDPQEHALLDWDVHFATDHQTGVAFDADLLLDDAGQSGNIRVLLHPGEENEQPIVAAVPVLALWADRENGSPGLMQFACYAESLIMLPQDAAEVLQADPNEPQAVLTGRVLACRSCVNSYSHGNFWHITLACCGCTLDLLCADELSPIPPAVGAMLTAPCRITALAESGVTG